MVDLSGKVCLVVDFGNFIKVAQRLGKDFGTVLYWTPTVINGFESHHAHDIGRGVDGIVRIYDFWDYYEIVDVFVFTDIFMGDLQDFLRRNGKVVFGGGKSGELEWGRLKFKQMIEQVGLNVNDYDVAVGVDELTRKLKRSEDKYIKSSLRGDLETFHHINYVLSKPELIRMKHDLGVYEDQETYIIEEPLEAIAEVGYDGFCVNGAFPSQSIAGIECKDAGYVGKMTGYNFLPKQIREVNDKLAPILAMYGYKSAFSTEIRIDKNKEGFFIDPTLRFPSPPTALTTLMYDNFSEIIWNVANGIVPEIKSSYRWGVQLIVKSDMAKTEPVALQFPREYLDNIEIKNLVVDDDGVYWYTPNGVELCEIASVSATGATMNEAIANVKKIAEQVKGHDIKINYESLDKINDEISNLRKNGINFLT